MPLIVEGKDLSNVISAIAEQLFTQRTVKVASRSFLVTQTSKQGLRQVDVGRIHAIEQNPNTGSRWAQYAREGKQVAQFLLLPPKGVAGRPQYIAAVVDGKIHDYSAMRRFDAA